VVHVAIDSLLNYAAKQRMQLFVICAWFLSVVTVFHIILGSLILSSTNFIGPRHALGVMARYVISVVVCRVILVYELAIVRICYRNGLNEKERESTD
jgi:TRAP-type C4-dicarboxylate transport system permease small subunit